MLRQGSFYNRFPILLVVVILFVTVSASDFLKRIKILKMQMDPKAAAVDDRIDRAMKLYS